MDLPSRLDLFSTGRDYVLQRATKIDPTQVDVAGSDVNIYVGVAATMTYQVVLQLGLGFNDLYLDGATGEALDRYAWDRYRMRRKGAAAALGIVRFYRTVTGTGGSILSGTKIGTFGDIEYITTTTATFATTTKEALADVRAVQAGKSFQVGKNMLRKFSVPSAIFDQTIRLNNDEATAGGEEIEDDDTFRERVRDFFRTARRGILSAIEFGARTVPGVVSAKAIEVLGYNGYPGRLVNLYIADSSGVASKPLANAVRTALQEYRCGGIAVLVYTSMPQIIDVLLSLQFIPDVDSVALTEVVRAAVVEYINSLPVNASLEKAALYSVLRRFTSSGLLVPANSIVAPVGDLIPDAGNTIRTTLDNVRQAA